MILSARAAIFEDYSKLRSFDEFLGDRRIDMQKGEIFVCESKDESVIGYLRLSTSHFFDWPLVVNICVREGFRRRGAGLCLIRFILKLQHLPRLYISTEQNNLAMKQLLRQVGATEIGHIDKLNFDDERELLYRLK